MIRFPELTPKTQEELELSDWLALTFIVEDDRKDVT